MGVLRVNPTRCRRCPMVTQLLLLLLLSTRIAVVGGCRTLLLARGPAATAAAEIKLKNMDITHSGVRRSAFWLCEKYQCFNLSSTFEIDPHKCT